METGDLQKKDLTDHPENYIFLTTLDEGKQFVNHTEYINVM